jgi:hypothetical protein
LPRYTQSEKSGVPATKKSTELLSKSELERKSGKELISDKNRYKLAERTAQLLTITLTTYTSHSDNWIKDF